MDSPLLQLKKVNKEYQLGEQRIEVLKDIDFKISKGELVAIIGASGSGKSTLMHIASLLDSPSSGRVLFNNIETTDYSETQRAKIRNQDIGFVFQQFHLLSRTSALNNVALPLVYAGVSRQQRIIRATEILSQVGLEDRLGNTPAQLSGGQQQRVAIARALVNNPQILFADEPTGNLDSKSGKEIESLIVKLNQQGRTVVIVTHDPKLAQIAHRQVTIKDGEIV